MATSPQSPLPSGPELTSREPSGGEVQDEVQNQAGFPWLWLALIVAAAVLLAFIVKVPIPVPRSARSARAAAPAPGQVQLADLNMTLAPVGSAMYLDVSLHNLGVTSITGLQLRADFKGTNGQIIASQLRFVAGVVGGSNQNNVQNLVDAPIRPNQSRRVRIYFDNLPQAWNKTVPDLTVVTVTGTAP